MAQSRFTPSFQLTAAFDSKQNTGSEMAPSHFHEKQKAEVYVAQRKLNSHFLLFTICIKNFMVSL